MDRKTSTYNILIADEKVDSLYFKREHFISECREGESILEMFMSY